LRGVWRMARCTPARHQRLAIDMKNPDIVRGKVADPVMPIDDRLLFGQVMAADRANAPLLLQLVGQQELLPAPVSPHPHARQIIKDFLIIFKGRGSRRRPGQVIRS